MRWGGNMGEGKQKTEMKESRRKSHKANIVGCFLTDMYIFEILLG